MDKGFVYCGKSKDWIDSINPEAKVRKLGETKDKARRKWDYLTYTLNPFEYDFYLYDLSKKSSHVERKLKQRLGDYHDYRGAGTEYYNFGMRKIEELFTNVLIRENIDFEIHIGDDIEKRPKNYQPELIIDKQVEFKPYWKKLNEPTDDGKIIYRYYQNECIKKIDEWNAGNEERGRLTLSCGSGKTEMIKYASSLFSKVLIIVPSLTLLEQTIDYFKPYNLINFSSTGTEDINLMILKKKYAIITTYQSAPKLTEIEFDIIIFDEAHRTTGVCEKHYAKMLNASSKKKLFLTATEKIYDIDEDDEAKVLYSMDDEEMYGKTIYQYPLRKAIMDGYLTDYRIIINVSNPDNKLQCVANYFNENTLNHSLIYFNTIERSKEGAKFLKENLKDVYVKHIDGNMSQKKVKKCIEKFKEKDKAIICSCRVFQEGINIPAVDSVIFYDMRNSMVDLTQCMGRCLRLYEGKMMSYAIFLIENVNYDKQKRKIQQLMRNLIHNDSIILDNIKSNKDKKENKNKRIDFISDNDVKTDEFITSLSEFIYDRWMNVLYERDEIWEIKYNMLKKYVEEHEGEIPKTRDKDLGNWMVYQRELFKEMTLCDEKTNRLNDISFLILNPENYDDIWNAKCEEIIKYKKEHNGELPKVDHKTNIGIFIDHQRQNFKNGKLPQHRIDQLNIIDVQLLTPPIIDLWTAHCHVVDNFYKEKGSLPKQTDKQNDGKWISTQRQEYLKGILSQERINILNNITPLILNPMSNDTKWDTICNKFRTYYENTDEIPTRRNPDFGEWIETQCRNFRKQKLSDHRINQLNAITPLVLHPMSINDLWETHHNHLIKYVKKNKSLPKQNDIKNEGDWIHHQKQKYKNGKLSQEKINKLEKINGWYW